MEQLFLQEKEPENKPTKYFAIAVAVILILIFLLLAAFFACGHFMPLKQKVLGAIRSTLLEPDPALSDLSPEEFISIFKKGQYASALTLYMDDISFEDSNLEHFRNLVSAAPSISFENKMNYPKKEFLSDMAFRSGGMTLLEASVFAGDSRLGLSCPTLYGKSLYVAADTFSQDLNRFLSGFPGAPTLDKNISFSLFDTQFTEKSFFTRYQEAYPEDTKALFKSMQVEKQPSPANSKTFTLTIPKEEWARFLTNAKALFPSRVLQQSALAVQTDSNFSCTLSTDENITQMLSCEFQQSFLQNNTPLQLSFSFQNETTKEQYQRTFSCFYDTRASEGNYTFTTSFSPSTHAFSINAALRDTRFKEPHTFLLDGTLSYDKAKTWTFDVNRAALTLSGLGSITLAGNGTFKESSQEFTLPWEPSKPLYEFTQQDFYEILLNLWKSPLPNYTPPIVF